MRFLLGAILLVVIAVGLGCNGENDSPTSPTPWTFSGSGNNVFAKPSSVRRVQITGTFTGSSSNFIVWCGSNLLVNVILGTAPGFASGTRYEGTHAAENCTEMRIENSNGVAWTFTEVR